MSAGMMTSQICVLKKTPLICDVFVNLTISTPLLYHKIT